MTLSHPPLHQTDMMGKALKKRASGSHAMNLESSRSHLVCIMNLRQSRPHAGQRISSKIHLIDLAGSEMVRVLFYVLPFFSCL